MSRLFGTDGIRGVANSDLTCDIAFRLGQAAVLFQGKKVLIARDTRISGQMFESAIASGVASVGGQSLITGIVPTPAVPHLVKKYDLNCGIMISASHNPPEYNGLKMFDARGYKLSDEKEDGIEAFILAGGAGSSGELADGISVGDFAFDDKASEDYVDIVTSPLLKSGTSFEGLKVVLDCGFGASYKTSRMALERLGADVIEINGEPDGLKINVNCGSTHLDVIKEATKEFGADIGIAHDGDADRVMMVSANGEVIDGDVVLSICACDLSSRGLLSSNTVVGTVMSNMGLKRSLESNGINLIQTKVGDRYVLEEMLKGGYCLGGEQSGHIIFLNRNTTGDGLASALEFLASIKRSGKTVNEAISSFVRFPQVLINVKVEDKEKALENEGVKVAVNQAKESLGDDGRVLLRPSGTEPVVRVMVEALDENTAMTCAKNIASKLR